MALCIKLYQENQCHEGIEWRFDSIMKCYLCLHKVVLHISLGFSGGRGEKFVDEGVCVCMEKGG